MKQITLLASLALTLSSAVAKAQTTNISAAAPPPVTSRAAANTDAEELARQTQNPVSDLISVPFQNNFNFGVPAN